MNGRRKFRVFKMAIDIAVCATALFPQCFCVFLWDVTSAFRQLPFIGLRYVLLKRLCKQIGDNVRIGTGVIICAWDRLELGNNVSLHDGCYVDASGGIKIGNDVSIAHQTSILSSNHSWGDPLLPIKYNAIILEPVQIMDDVWVGCGCRILAGVSIGARSVVAAGAVVTKPISGDGIYGGIPTKKIKEFRG